jgi:glyoxylase-like metal-dependent hydrolase (beta-lactamase superfamily II)
MMRPLAGLRRIVQCVALGFFAALLGACAGIQRGATCEEPGTDAVPWESLAPGVWVWRGVVAEISAANLGQVAPTSLLIDGGQAAVIDPGPSFLHANRVRRSVECRFGAHVRWVVNTHAHAENVLGNVAFADLLGAADFDIVSTAATLAAMKERCPACLASLTARVGTPRMAGTHIVLPSRSVGPGEILAVGGQRLQVMEIEQGHTEGDLVLWLPALKILWAGGLVYQGRVPELSQGSLDGWLSALDHLDTLAPERIVSAAVSEQSKPGKLPEAMHATRAYLAALRAGVLQAMDRGHQPQESGLVPLPAFADWAGYAERHTFNVQRAWRELEPIWMDQDR